jgi:putative transposase
MTIFEHINDRVDAPPGGIAMCQNGRSLICHPNEEHPWTMLAS